MADPTQKSPDIEAFLNDLMGGNRQQTIIQNKCVPAPIGCGKEVGTFRDALSEKEYRISGLCQECQDSVFGGPDD